MDDSITSLEKSSKDQLKRFENNLVNNNPDKCHVLASSCKNMKMKKGDFEIENVTCEKLLGVHFDAK